jgi:hypothetical protein
MATTSSGERAFRVHAQAHLLALNWHQNTNVGRKYVMDRICTIAAEEPALAASVAAHIASELDGTEQAVFLAALELSAINAAE